MSLVYTSGVDKGVRIPYDEKIAYARRTPLQELLKETAQLKKERKPSYDMGMW